MLKIKAIIALLRSKHYMLFTRKHPAILQYTEGMCAEDAAIISQALIDQGNTAIQMELNRMEVDDIIKKKK